MTVRELIALARGVGFRRVHPRITGSTAVWSDGRRRVEVDVHETYAELRILHRSATRFECWDQRGLFFPPDVRQAFVALFALGVLSREEVAA